MREALLEIPGTARAVFTRRPNRFILNAVNDRGELLKAHVADPGRLRELLRPGNDVLLIPAPQGRQRKTEWSLVAALSEEGWVLVNTSYHSMIARLILSAPFSPFPGTSSIRSEVVSPLGSSRFDFLLDGRKWVEVKGCTLLRNGIALFPDAPTSRGARHVKELGRLSAEGHPAAVLFLVLVPGATALSTNREMDPVFSDALADASRAGVDVRCAEVSFDGRTVYFTGELPFIRDPLP